jgi:hypothetical protein
LPDPRTPGIELAISKKTASAVCSAFTAVVRSSYSNIKLSRYNSACREYDRAQPTLTSNRQTRNLKQYGTPLLAIASFAVLLAVWLVGLFLSGLGAATRGPGAQTDVVHFNLLGPDWAKVPKGYSGILPEKVVAGLNIPKEYVTHNTNLLGGQSSAKAVEDIPIAFSYPSMTGAAEDQTFATRIDAIIRLGREKYFREGTHSIIFGNGNTREPSLDVNGLCGYVDRIHSVYAGYEFYTACRVSDQTFSIFCDAPDNGRRICIADNFLKDHMASQLIYQYATLKDHLAVLRAVKKLVMSFLQPGPDESGRVAPQQSPARTYRNGSFTTD